MRTVIESHNSNNSIRTSTLPCQSESFFSPSDFQHYISTAMSTLLEHKILTFFGSNNLYLWIMLTDKMNPFFCFLTDYNTLRIL